MALPATHALAARAELRASDLAGERIVERCHCEYARHFRRGKRAFRVAAVERVRHTVGGLRTSRR